MAGHTHSEIVSLSRMEVVEVGRRRRWSDDRKLQILEEASAIGTTVRAVARRHEVSPSQIYEWRKKFWGSAAVWGGESFAAVVVSPDDRAAAWPGRMEVRCGNGRTITAGRDVDVVVLAQLVVALVADEAGRKRLLPLFLQYPSHTLHLIQCGTPFDRRNRGCSCLQPLPRGSGRAAVPSIRNDRKSSPM
jgi:transposase